MFQGKRWWLLAALVVVAVTLSGIKAYRVHLDNTAGERSCAALLDQAAGTRSAVAAVTNGAKLVAVLGDSFTSGYTLADPTSSWQAVAGRAAGWSVESFGVATSGYVATPPCGDQRYAARLAAATGPRPDVLVIEGGLNDAGADPAAAGAAAAAVYRDALPLAGRVVVLGPTLVPAADPAVVRQLDADLAAAARSAGVPYVSALDWLPDPASFVEDGLHPTVDGHREYGERAAASL